MIGRVVTDGNTADLRHPKSPIFRLVLFWVASVFVVICLILNTYIVCEHWNLLGEKKSLLLPVLIGVQCINVWLRAVRSDRVIQKLLAGISDETPEQLKLIQAVSATASRSLTDLLFWSFSTMVLLLVYVDTAFSQ